MAVTLLEERRDASVPRVLGHLVALNGMQGIIASQFAADGGGEYWSVGHLITIVHGKTRLIGVVCELTAVDHQWQAGQSNTAHVKIELTGEIVENAKGEPKFHRGIRSYPRLGAVAHRIKQVDLAAIYAFDGNDGVLIGHLSQDERIPAKVGVFELISRHFAVIGSTGVGKTTAVSLLLKSVIAVRPKLRILIIDPHNEYARNFQGEAAVFDSDDFELPFWMFRFDEIVEIVYSGRRPSATETDSLYEVIKSAKVRFAAGQGSRRGESNITADTPVPWRVAEALKIIDEWTGKLDQTVPRTDLRVLRNRLESLARDPRFRFMFGKALIEDTMVQVVSRIFRIPTNGAPVSIVQMAGLPNEVVDAVVSVLARLAFEIAVWSGGAYEIAVVCEEAHRYIPNDRTLGFGPTRQAIGRIAKEGRKYGVSLGVVSQRPSELDGTVLSQCSTMFAMRLPNEADKAIIRAALADSSASIISFLSSLADREAIAFGAAVPTPMQLKFTTVQRAQPQQAAAPSPAPATRIDVARIVARLRGDHGSPQHAGAVVEQQA